MAKSVFFDYTFPIKNRKNIFIFLLECNSASFSFGISSKESFRYKVAGKKQKKKRSFIPSLYFFIHAKSVFLWDPNPKTAIKNYISYFSLASSMYADVDLKHCQKVIEMKTTELASQDLEKYYKALDRAIMRYHSLKLADINKIIKEYWVKTYQGGGQ